jgi:protoporphyrinogen oxidase
MANFLRSHLLQKASPEVPALAREELSKIGIIDSADVIDLAVLRMEKTCPAHVGTFDRFAEVRQYVDCYENLFLVDRNGMHHYIDQDHFMLTAMMAVENMIAGNTDENNLWEVNAEKDYHEEKGNPR